MYILELLLAVPAVYTLWGQVGGQGHLDLMPWHWKLLLGGGACWALVRLTKSAIEHDRFWNAATLAWLGGVLFIGLLMGSATYYCHLHEATEDVDSEESTTAARIYVEIGRHA